MFKKILLLCLLLLFSGCNSKAPITNRDQFIIISQSQELALGEQSYEEVLKKSKVIKNTKDAKRVKTIGKNIARVANIPSYKWEFNLIENKSKNAFCLPGGKVAVYTGILDIAKNDDQLATVISHEIAHALARHGAERMSSGLVTQSVQFIGNIILSSNHSHLLSSFNIAYGLGSTYGVMLPYGRLQENEADEIGVHLMYKAGYNIHEALKFWENMSKGEKEQNEFFSTHPSSKTRIDNIKRVIKEIENEEKRLGKLYNNEILGKKIH